MFYIRLAFAIACLLKTEPKCVQSLTNLMPKFYYFVAMWQCSQLKSPHKHVGKLVLRISLNNGNTSLGLEEGCL